ncbi:MAG: ABC transporter permease subunit [Propionibacteriales bacterium]|nr:ABC transporter permease subunit [Propionibacteriales bacterium]
MKRALAYEWTRIRTLRSTWWLTGLAIFLGIGISTLFAWAIHHDFTNGGVTSEDLDQLGPVVVTQLAASGEIPSVICFVLAILGIFAWGHEYRHGMIRASLTALNSRTQLWVAKFLVVGAWVAVVAAVTLIGSGVVASFFLRDYVDVFSGDTWQIIGRQVLYGVVLTWLAMAFTSITRSQAFALVSIFLWPFLIETLINVFFRLVPGLRDHTELLRFRPFDAGGRLVDAFNDPTGTFGDPLSAWGGLVVFGGTAVVGMVASYLLFTRRDA